MFNYNICVRDMGVNEAKYGALEKLFNAKFTILSEDLKKVQQNTIEAEQSTDEKLAELAALMKGIKLEKTSENTVSDLLLKYECLLFF